MNKHHPPKPHLLFIDNLRILQKIAPLKQHTGQMGDRDPVVPDIGFNYYVRKAANRMENATFKSLLGFIGRVTVVHVVTYFSFGILSVLVVPVGHMMYAIPEMDIYFRPISSPHVMAGTLFQLLRGPIIAIGIYPFRQVFIQNKWGWLYLWGLFLTLSVLAPAGAAPGSIEGYVYTKLPVWFHLTYLPDIMLQTLAFSVLVFIWERRREKKIAIPLIAAFTIIIAIFLPALLTGSLTASS